MIQSNIFQLEGESQWQDLGNGMQRLVFGYDHRIMMVKVKFETGAVGVLHHHTHTQISYVESGVFETSVGEEKKILKKGDAFFAPSEVVHGVVCLEAGMLVDVFSPHREDFL